MPCPLAARATAEGIRERLSYLIKVDGDVPIIGNRHVNNQGRPIDKTLPPAIAVRSFLNESYCLGIDRLTNMIVNDNLQNARQNASLGGN